MLHLAGIKDVRRGLLLRVFKEFFSSDLNRSELLDILHELLENNFILRDENNYRILCQPYLDQIIEDYVPDDLVSDLNELIRS
jgi:hypothetical protein